MKSILAFLLTATLLLSHVFSYSQTASIVQVGGTNSSNTVPKATATVVDPNLTITSDGTISGFTVQITGSYTSGDVLGYNGSLPGGITVLNSGFNTTYKALQFAGVADAATWQDLLRRVTITTANVTCYPEQRQVSFIVGPKLYNLINGHFYEKSASATSWITGYNNAKITSYFGRQAYMVTITSAAENSLVASYSESWLGSSDDYRYIDTAAGFIKYSQQGSSSGTSSTGSEGFWHWVTGPEKGTLFSSGNTGSGTPLTASGQYANWNGGEPNGNNGGENFGQMLSGGTGRWNDLNGSQNLYTIYEYGDMSTDNVSSNVVFTRTINLSGAPSGTIINGNTTVCSGTNSTILTLSGLVSGGTVSKWQSSTDNFLTTTNTTDITNTTTTYTATNITQNTFYRALVNTTGCTNNPTSSTFIKVSSAVAGNIVADNNTICNGASVNFTLNGYSGTISKWQVSTSSTFASSVTDINNTTAALSYALPTAGTYYFRAVLFSCANSVNTTPYTITVINGSAPVGGTVSSMSYCGGSNSGSLSLTGSTGNVSKWQFSTDGGIVWTDFANTTTTLNYTGITATRQYRAVLTNGSCGTALSAAGVITVNPASVAGTASGITSVCAGTNSTTLSLSGNIGSIQWQSSTNNSTFTDIAGETGANYIATNLSATTYYRAVVTNASCTPATSNAVTVTVKQPSTSTTNASICAGGSYSFAGSNYTTTGTYLVHLTNAVGCDSAATLNLTVNALPPTPTITPSGATTFCAVGSVTLTSDAATSYTWTGGATTQAITVTTGGTYSVTVSNGNCTATSAPVSVTVNALNTITLSSIAATTSQTVYANTAITNITYATANATGASFSGLPNGVTGSWSANVVTISGTPTVSGTYNYTVTLTGGCGTITASGIITVASVTITSSIPTNTICVGTSVTFTATPTAATSPTYQWKKNGVAISNATNSTYTTNTLTNNDVITVDMTVASATGGRGSIVSSGLIQNLDANKTASYAGTGSTWYDISGNSNNGTLNAASFATTSGYSYFNLSNTYISAPVAKNASMTFNVWAKTTDPSNSMLFNAGNPGSGPDLFFWSNAIHWNVWDAGSSPFGVNTNIIDANWHNYTVVVDATANNAKLYFDGVLKGTATYHISSSSNLYIGGAGPGDAWYWKGAVASFQTYNRALTTTEITTNYNALNGATLPFTSNGITTVVNALPTPSFTAQAGASACINTDVTYTTQAGQSNYVWTVPGVLGADYSITSGGVSSTDNTVTLKWLTGGSKVVTINYTNTNSCTAVSATASTATSISAVSVGGTATPLSSAICSGSNTSVSLSGNTGTIQWQQSLDGINNWTNVSGGSGATSATYVTPNLSATTYYRAVVTSGACSIAYSSVATVNVNAPSVGGTISGSAAVCPGTNSTLLTLSGNTGVVTKWQSSLSASFTSATDIANTISTLSADNLSTTTYYRAVVVNGVCPSANSATATVTVNPLNTITLSSAAATSAQIIYNNSALTNITYTTTNATGASFSGLPNGVTGNWSANVVTISGTPTVSGIYNYTVTLTGGCGTITASGTITVASVAITSSIPTNAICAGTSVTFTATPAFATNPTYQWKKNGVAISGATNSTYTTNTLTNNDVITVDMTVANATGGNVSGIVTSGLSIYLNAKNTTSYPGTGSTWYDISGNGYNSTLSNVTYSSTNSGEFAFNGSNSIVRTPSIPNTGVGNNTSVTWSAWVYPTTVSGTIMYMSSDAGGGGWNMPPLYFTNKRFIGSVYNNTPISDPNDFTLNTWYHVTLVYDGTARTSKLYVNGAMVSNATNQTFSGPGSTAFMFLGLVNGGCCNNATNFTGRMSSFMAYGGKALTDAEVLQNYNNGVTASITSNAITTVVNALPTPSFTAQAGSDACINTDVTYTTQSGQSNYLWTVPGVLGTDYSITSGGVSSTDNTVTLKWLTTGNKTVSINYTNSNSCTAVAATNSTTTLVSPVSAGGTASASNGVICYGSNTSISVTGYTGTIQWQRSADGLTNWTNVSGGSGATSAIYNTPNLASTTYYRAVVTSGACSLAYSSTVMVEVNPTSVGGTIAGSTTICAGINSTTLSLSGYTGAITKWQSSTSSNFASATDINNTTASLTANNLSTTTYYKAVITSGVCSSTFSSTATIVVNPLPTASINGTTAVCKDASAPSITFTGSGATAPYTFTYTVNGGAAQTVVSTGNTATVGVPTSVAGVYTYELVSVKDASSTLCANTATGSATVTVNSPSASTTVIKVPFGATYVFNGVTYSATGIYTAHLTNAVGCDSIATLDFTVDPKPSAGSDQTVACGSTTKTVTLTGTLPTTGVWSSMAGNDPTATIGTNTNGVVEITLPVAPFTGKLSYVYTTFGGKDTVDIYVTGPTSPVINVNAGSPIICSGSTVQLCPQTWGFSNYQWYKDGYPVAGATGTSSCITVDATGIGSYTLAGTNGAGCWSVPSAPQVVSTTNTLTKPTISASGSTILCNGGSVILTSSSATGNLWFKNGNSTGAITPSITVTEPGDYSVLVSTGTCTSAMSLTTTVAGGVKAGFITANATNNCDSTFSFTSTSANTTSTWNFGDGTTATGNSVTHKYATVALFTVQQAVISANGCKDTAVQTVTIVSCPPPPAPTTCNITPGFTIINNTVNGGSYTYISNSTITNGNMTYFWDLGNGTTSTLISPSVTYATAGTYQVKLVVTGDLGCKDSITQSVVVTIAAPPVTPPACTAPVADFTIANATQCLTGNAFSFTNTSTGTAPSYTWTFGDGSAAVTTTAAAYSYTTANTYTVTLVATNSCGSHQVSKTVTVNTSPATPASISGSTSITAGATTTLSSATTGGVWSSSNTAVATVDANTGVVTAIAAGSTTISYTVSNICGATATSLGITVTAVVPPVTPPACTAPVANFSINNATQCLTGNSFSFTNSSTGTTPSYTWTFGDGSASVTTTNATYSYTAGNTYTVTLVATNSCGSNQVSKTVTVATAPATPSGISGATTITAGTTSNYSSATAGGVWGSSNTAVAIVNPSTGVVTAVTAGTTNISYTVSNSCGTTVTSLSITVTAAVPPVVVPPTPAPCNINASFSVNNLSQCVNGNQYVFTNTTTGGTAPFTYLWDLNDGTTATTANVTKTYANYGDRDVTMMVTDANGCTSHAATTQIHVGAQPKAGFSILTRTGNGQSTTFISSSTIAAGNMTYLWDLGNGQTSTLINPTTSYTPGNYTIKLVVSGIGTCKDSSIQSITELAVASVKVYPNPVMDVIQVSFVSASATPTTFKLMDLAGRTLQVQTVTPSSRGVNVLATMNTRGLQSGSYVLYVSDEQNGFLATKAILKQ
jgi:PKD repeat protein